MSLLYTIYEKVQKLKEQNKEVIEMNVGDPDIRSQEVIESIKNNVCYEYMGYGSSKGENTLIDKIKKVFKIEDEVVIIPGSKFGIYEILYLNRNKKVGLIEPYWSSYELILKEFKTRYKEISLDPFEMHIDKKNLKDVDLVIINNPNNPTSKKISNLDEVLEFCKNNNIKVLYDAAYEDLVYDNKKIDPNLVDYYVYSFSKSFGIPGARIGFLTCDPKEVESFIKLNQITISCVPKFIQKGLERILDRRSEITKKISEEYKKRSNTAYKILSTKYEVPKPEAPFYIFPKLGKNFDYLNLLEKQNVAIVPGLSFGKKYVEYARISLTSKYWKEGLTRIVEKDI